MSVIQITPVNPPAGGQTVFDPRTSSALQGKPDDAKWYRVPFTIAVGASLLIDPAIGMAFFLDTGTANSGVLFITLDTCFGEMAIQRGLYCATRLFRKVTLRLDSSGAAPDGVGSLIISRNPRFMVFQGRG